MKLSPSIPDFLCIGNVIRFDGHLYVVSRVKKKSIDVVSFSCHERSTIIGNVEYIATTVKRYMQGQISKIIGGFDE